MKKNCKEWVKKFLKDVNQDFKRNFLQMLELEKKLIKNNLKFYYYPGIGVNNVNNLSSFKLFHRFISLINYENKTFKELFNQIFILKWIEKVNKIFNTKFDVGILEKLFSFPLAASFLYNPITLRFSVAFAFKFNFCFNRFDKITFYFLPENKERIKEIGRLLNIKEENLNLKCLNSFRYLRLGV